MSFMARDFSKDELADQDLRDYVASDTDSEGLLEVLHYIYTYLCIYYFIYYVILINC